MTRKDHEKQDDRVKKLKVKREMVKDLDPKDKTRDVKGGSVGPSREC